MSKEIKKLHYVVKYQAIFCVSNRVWGIDTTNVFVEKFEDIIPEIQKSFLAETSITIINIELYEAKGVV